MCQEFMDHANISHWMKSSTFYTTSSMYMLSSITLGGETNGENLRLHESCWEISAWALEGSFEKIKEGFEIEKKPGI